MTDAARRYIAACRISGSPVNAAEVARLTGLSNGALRRFILGCSDDLPPTVADGRDDRIAEGFLMLACAILEVPSETTRRAIGDGVRAAAKARKEACKL